MFGIMPWRNEKGTVARREADAFSLMRRDFDTLFNRVFGALPLVRAEEWEKPAWGLEVVEDEKEFVIRAEAPGCEAGEFDFRVTGDVLSITAEHKVADDKAAKNGAKSYSRLERLVTLPAYVDTAKVEATYRNGVLVLHFPRRPEAEGKKIEVKA
jgi:HSP20 family protein